MESDLARELRLYLDPSEDLSRVWEVVCRQETDMEYKAACFLRDLHYGRYLRAEERCRMWKTKKC